MMNKKRFVIIISLILFGCVSPYLVPWIINVFLFLFKNTSGQFDLSIFWSALSGVATFFLGIVALWQTSIFRKNDLVLSHKVILYKIPEVHKEKYNKIEKSYVYRFGSIPKNIFIVFANEDSKAALSLNVRFVTANGIIPKQFRIKNIIIRTLKENKLVLSDDLKYQKDPADIIDLNEKGFNCNIDITDEKIREINYEDLYISFQISFYSDLNNGFIETNYMYGCNIDFILKEDDDLNLRGLANFKDLYIHENGARFIKKII